MTARARELQAQAEELSAQGWDHPAREQEIKHVAEERGLNAGLALARAQEIEWQRGELRGYESRERQILASTSWQITRPLRALASFVRGIPKVRYLNRSMLRLVARDVYYLIPMPMRLRIGIRRVATRIDGRGRGSGPITRPVPCVAAGGSEGAGGGCWRRPAARCRCRFRCAAGLGYHPGLQQHRPYAALPEVHR